MSGCPESGRHGNIVPSAVLPGEDAAGANLFTNLSEPPFLSALSPLEETQRVDGSWNRDGDLQGCGQLETRWVLWHEFMKEHAHLDTWLRSAEQAVSSANPTHITYVAAKEELMIFERLRCEAGSRLVQLDGLTRRNRTLTRLFAGAMRVRLLASAKECGRRWDDVSATLESITARLKLFVSEWEGFEAEREALALWLADLDVRLTKVDHLNGSTCEKLRHLESFQQCVLVNSARINALLQRGEELIQRSEPADARHVESRLLELLRHCSHVYGNIARTHTRLLSMRLVFEDDWILSQATDSGCPSETLLEEEGALDKSGLDVPAVSNHPRANPAPAFPSDLPSPVHHPPPPPPSPSSPTHEHLGLEWDPSVDVGRSVSCDDGDSSYFSASPGLYDRDGLKRWSFLSSLSSPSDISNGVTNQEADVGPGWLDHTCPGVSPPAAPQDRPPRPNVDRWATSTPGRRDREPVGYDDGRVTAWLGVQSPAPPGRRTSCSRAVQTDGEAKDETSSGEAAGRLPSEPRATSSSGAASSSFSSSSLLYPGLLYVLLAAALALLACLILLDSPCPRSSEMPHTFHLTLRYVNGPPPT